VIGTPLVQRWGRGIVATAAGRALLPAAREALMTLRAARHELQDVIDPDKGLVALGFLHTLGPEIVPQLLKGFRASYPEVRFGLVQDGGHELLARLRDGDLDLCLTAPLPAGADVLARGLAEQRIDLFVPLGHRLTAAATDGVPLSAAAAEDFIVMEPGYGLRAITDTMCREAGFAPRIAFEGEEVGTARGLVGAGLGVSLLPATASSLADPSVVPVRITTPKAARTIGIAWPANRPLTAPAAAFRDFALTYAGRLPQTGGG
jgi:DNA-binding transcriptional LysR family regulator